MSILLESLKQSKKTSDNDVPSLDDSHFDDEMLGDEWLLKKVRFWKAISAILFAALLVSWFMIYIDYSATRVLSDVQETHSKVDDKVTQMPLPEKEKEATPAIEKKAANDQAVYQPKRIEKPINEIKQVKQVSENNSVTQKPQQQSTATNKIIEFEALPESTLSEMPDLEIASYAVSNNVKKSFVVLNGAFYGVGETIAPHLVLIAIKQEAIVVKYKGQLISKKYSL